MRKALWISMLMSISIPSFGFDLDFPDLVPLESEDSFQAMQSQLSQIKKTNSSPAIDLSTITLNELEEGLKNNKVINPVDRTRLIMLIQELKGHPDDAYITLKSLNDSPKDLWHNFKELQLSERLGLKDDVQRLGKELAPVLFDTKFQIDKVAFCSSVQSYGMYTTIPDDEIKSGQLVILYVEYRGLHYTAKDDRFLSRCLASFDVFDEKQAKVFSYSAPSAFEDLSYSQRKEAFIWMKWRPNLPPGKYRLALHLQDDFNKKIVDQDHAFELK